MKNLHKFEVRELKTNESVLIKGGCSFAYDVGFGVRLLLVGPTNWGLEFAAYAQNC